MSRETVPTVNDREAAEQLARCVATMVYYQTDGWSWSGAQLLWEQARSLTAWVTQARPEGELGTLVLTPLQTELTARFGPKLGHRLHQEFLRALRDAAEG